MDLGVVARTFAQPLTISITPLTRNETTGEAVEGTPISYTNVRGAIVPYGFFGGVEKIGFLAEGSYMPDTRILTTEFPLKHMNSTPVLDVNGNQVMITSRSRTQTGTRVRPQTNADSQLTVSVSNAGSATANAVQLISLTGNGVSGTFTLTYGGQTTAAIAYNATTSVLQASLTALGTIGLGNVAVTGNPGSWRVTFQGTLGLQTIAPLVANDSGIISGLIYEVIGIASEFSHLFGIAGHVIRVSEESQAAGLPQ